MSIKARLSASRSLFSHINTAVRAASSVSRWQRIVLVLGGAPALLVACQSLPQVNGTGQAPYAHSRTIPDVQWDFSDLPALRRAHGSDLWPCAWARDDALYCAWGDGGGFDGDSDQIGRVSLGFARLTGSPESGQLSGRNIWGSPPYAESAATFGGKVGSMVAAEGVLYAVGGFWSPLETVDAVHKGGAGPRKSLAWSQDAAHTWNLAAWTSDEPLGAFLDRGQEPADEGDEYLYLYFFRAHDDKHLYLKRSRAKNLRSGAVAPAFEYYSGRAGLLRSARWSMRESEAAAIFTDGNHVEGPCVVYVAALKKYLLTSGHYAGESDNESSAGQVGLFEASYAWGPWRTIGYYEDWGNLHHETRGDYLGLRLPSKWFSSDGTGFWAVFSGLNAFDSFNVVRGQLVVRDRPSH